MHEDQVLIDLATARSLIRDQFPTLANEPVRRLETNGTVNAIFRIGDGYAARFPLRFEAPATLMESLRSEAAAMTELAQHCRFPTPTPVFVGCSGNSYPMPWTIQTWITGDVATPAGLAASTLLADDLVFLIEALRATETRGRTFSGEGRGGDLPDHDNWMKHRFQESEGLLDVARLRVMWDRLRELPAAGDDVMSHCDLIPANLLRRRRTLGRSDRRRRLLTGRPVTGPGRRLASPGPGRQTDRQKWFGLQPQRMASRCRLGGTASHGLGLVLPAHEPGHCSARPKHAPADSQ